MRRRRFLRILAVLAAIGVLFVLTIPYWLGSAINTFGKPWGATIGSYERLGYNRFILRDVEYRREGLRVTLSRAEADTPMLWIWRHVRGAPTNIVGDNWVVDVQRRTTPPPPNAPPSKLQPGWVPLRGLLQRIATQLDIWLPQARVGSGVVRWPGGELTLVSAAWEKRELAIEDIAYGSLKASGKASFPAGEDLIRVALRTAEGNNTNLESRGPAITGDITWWDQKAAITANFPPQGWVPPQASLLAETIALPADRLKLGDAYTQVRGRARVDWAETHFIADIVANAEPTEGKKAPPLELALKGQGDTQAFTVEAFNATLPGITGRLSEAVTVERSGRFRESAARFVVQADLAQQPWFTAQGVVTGEAWVESSLSTSPAVEFRLQASNVVAQGLALAQVSTEGQFQWPLLQVRTGYVVGQENERIEFHGGWDFRAKEARQIVADGTLRRKSLERWLPAQPEFDAITLHAEAAGALPDIVHSGRAQLASVKFSGVNPAALTAEWRGKGAAIEAFSARATAGATTLSVGGAASAEGVDIRELELARENTPLLTLSSPATIRWRPTLSVEALHLAGPDRSLDANVTWGPTGRIEIAAHNIASPWFADFFAAPPVAWQLDLLAVTGNWDRGPMTYSIAAGASAELGQARKVTANIAAHGDKDGLIVDALRATESDVTVVNATGRVPVVLRPATPEPVEMVPTGALRIAATVAPNAVFWQQLATATGVELVAPEAALRVEGTWQRPEGEIQLKAAKAAFDPKRITRPLPTIEALDIHLTGDRAGVNLETFAVNVEGQPIRAHGRLPVPDSNWSAALKEPLVVFQRGADLRLAVPEADIAVFSRFLPQFLAPQGRIQIDVGYKAGSFDGSLRLRDAATKPLGPLGVLQEVNAEIKLSGRKLIIGGEDEKDQTGVTARTGGQPVTLRGTIELPEQFSGTAEQMIPRFDLTLKGTNLPFVRQTGLLVRGDLDLKLLTPPNGTIAGVSGTVRLRDSLFLQDIRAFLPRAGGGGGSRRPPYFEVSTPPLDQWTLAIDVLGDRFLRLTTTVFNGVASANFRLRGTLGEPRAIGDVVIEEGLIRMPFASFDVQQGFVRLTEANPYEPTIFVRGVARRFGYDLAMEVDGEGSRPNVTFTSSPALDSEQVLLMVMTGSAPSNEITVTGGQRVTQLGAFVGQSLLSSFSDGGGPEISISTGEKVSREGKETLEVEVKLSDRLRAVGERNEFDDVNGGLKWRLFPRQTEREKEKAEMKKQREEARHETN